MKPKHIKAYMKCCDAFAECSNATRLKVGTVIVKDNRIISCGYNAHAEHIHDPCETPDGLTDVRVRHSEKNALMGLIRSNQSAVGATMVCNYSCCAHCAIDIVDSGIVTFIYEHEYRSNDGLEYLKKNNVKVIKWEDKEQLTL